METILASIAVISGLAGIFGFGLAYANKRLAVEKDPKIQDLEEILPSVNCGACGYAGCSAYAEALANENADTTLCAPGGSDVIKKIASILGVDASEKIPMTARIYCGGDDVKTKIKYKYNGTYDCVSANALFGGFLECPTGCLGLGSCVKVCNFDAIKIDENGNTVIIDEKCTGCGACVLACPKHLIELVAKNKPVFVACNTTDKGGVCNKYCKVSCIGCKKCEKACQDDAIHVNNFLAKIDYDKCTACGACVKVCPTKCIHTNDPSILEEKPSPKEAEKVAV